MTELDAKVKSGIRRTVFILVAIIFVILLLFIRKISEPRILSQMELQANGLIFFEDAREFSSFNLLTNKKQAFNSHSLQGHWSLIFFGFAHCPDICPTTLNELTQVLKGLDKDLREKVQVVFVTLDPNRDDTEKLDTYLNYFDETFIGVTGDFLEVFKFARSANIAFSKVTQGDDYTIDHSSQIVLVNPSGQYQGFFKAPLDQQKMNLTLTSVIKSHSYDPR